MHKNMFSLHFTDQTTDLVNGYIYIHLISFHNVKQHCYLNRTYKELHYV